MRLRFVVPILLALSGSVRAAVLEGVVVENRSGRPLARSRVSLETIRAEGLGQNGETLSDSAGRFRFLSLPAGVYRVRARRSGYLTTSFGQRRWNGGGSPISLQAGSQFFADIRMPKLGIVTGEVVDENGVGLAGITVQAYQAGKRPLRGKAFATTDDRGVYRIGVEPGIYYVGTGPAQLEDGRGLLPTYLGQATTVKDARAVEVAMDQEQTLRSIEPLPGKLGSIGGTVQGGLAASVSLYTDTGKREVQVEPGASFQFEALAPGTYPLIAVSQDSARAAYVKVQVSGATHIVLNLASMSRVRMRTEENGRPTGAGGPSVVLMRNEPFESFAVSVSPGETVQAVPGEYTALAAAPPGSYIASVRSNPSGPRPDAPNVVDAVPGETLDITVSLRSPAAELHGKVLAPDGEPSPGARVFLKPLPDGRILYTGGADRTTASASGEFVFAGLPPGSYKVFSSFEILEPTASDWESGDVRTVTLGENQKEKLELKLVGGL